MAKEVFLMVQKLVTPELELTALLLLIVISNMSDN
jgi:hypothetical protein